jgi:acetyltransferase-like isoleucine patch superfamily enzyme
MLSKLHFLVGFFKNLFNKRISILAFISSRSELDKTCVVYRGVKIKSGKVGAHTYISNNTDVENAEIGKFCSIADHCRIGMSGHSLQFLSTSPIFTQKANAVKENWTDKDLFQNKTIEERVFIGNDVWVGSHVLINGGVHIGDGACIAAGAVVVKDVPPYAIVGGVPAKVIRYRFSQEVIVELLRLKWWNMDEALLKQQIELFQMDNIDIESLKLINK